METQLRPVTRSLAKFCPGEIVATPNALAQIPHDEILHSLGHHVQGDWGQLDTEDLQSNERALKQGGRLFSQYFSVQRIKFWIITEADRSVTTVLLPEDY
ncbi:MAG: hypothetical protein V4697_00810 [Patescibacteria group bacterium]